MLEHTIEGSLYVDKTINSSREIFKNVYNVQFLLLMTENLKQRLL